MHNPPTTDDLVAHAGLLRALAMDIVREGHRADDVVQDTLLAALAKPPRRGLNVRSWLVAVARNLARLSRRSDERRTRREQGAAVRESVPGPSEVMARVEILSAVLAAVGQLAEPYRSAVVLRYFDGSSVAAIARLLDVPEATVRTRLSRALAQLRIALERRFSGERPLEMLALGSLPLGAKNTTVLATGALLMKTKILVAACVAVLVTAAVVAWPEQEPPHVPATVAFEPSPPTASQEATTQRPIEERAEVVAASVHDAPARVVPEQKTPQSAPPETTRVPPAEDASEDAARIAALTRPLTVIITDEADHPLANLGVSVGWNAGMSGATTDAAGKAVFYGLPMRGILQVRGEPRVGYLAPKNAFIGSPSQREARLRYRSAETVSGIVLDPSGAPAAEVVVDVRSAAKHLLACSVTDDKGRFAVSAPSGEAVDLEVTSRRDPRSSKDRLAVRRIEERGSLRGVFAPAVGLTIHLEKAVRDRTLTARVVSWTGQPAAHVEVVASAGYDIVGQGHTDATGNVMLKDLPCDTIEVRASTSGLDAGSKALKVVADGQEVLVTLRRGFVLRGVLIDPDGNPVPNAYVSAQTEDDALSSAESNSEGRFEIIVPEHEHIYLTASANSRGMRLLARVSNAAHRPTDCVEQSLPMQDGEPEVTVLMAWSGSKAAAEQR